MQTLAQLLGKTRTPLTNLFSTDGSGWNDIVDLTHFTSLAAMQKYLLELSGLSESDHEEFSFEFPQSLDDFGLTEFFQDNYPEMYIDYLNQWTDLDEEVIEQQIQIQTDYQHMCPAESSNCLYLLVASVDGTDRVMYVGKAQNGLLMRFFNGTKIGSQLNNYIGDCRSYESHKKPNYTWRAKSAELRRRGIYKVVWTELPSSELELVESKLIIRKRELIEESSGISGTKDPVNSRE